MRAEYAPRQTERFGPESARRVRQFYNVPDRGYESIHVLFFDYERRGHFQHHEIVPAHLGEKLKSRNNRITIICPNMPP